MKILAPILLCLLVACTSSQITDVELFVSKVSEDENIDLSQEQAWVYVFTSSDARNLIKLLQKYETRGYISGGIYQTSKSRETGTWVLELRKKEYLTVDSLRKRNQQFRRECWLKNIEYNSFGILEKGRGFEPES